ncbi:hypothetical protein LX64_04638 [Chitinophaga skermanii]|uniref:Outer membrane protein with beta-barrel domain n=1 Tax=Chitinophaga skermanii TaxID=331697 RepID=A0A327Q3Q0_9BACT|nr:hypothetical protein [Chitinophaga skermanii]RAI98653.1 hypothetical protein LX64_04638 [Chitinophaga skermanii]
MQTSKLLAIVVCCLALSISTYAQRIGKKKSFGFGIEYSPITDNYLSHYYVAGVGASFSFRYKVGPGYITAGTGVKAFAPNEKEGMDPEVGVQIPLKAGYKYNITKHLFVMGEIGANFYTTTYYDEYDYSDYEYSTGFIAAPSIGVQFGIFEAALRYDYFTMTDYHYENYREIETRKGVGVPTIHVGFNF